jgi:hypothetical protein
LTILFVLLFPIGLLIAVLFGGGFLATEATKRCISLSCRSLKSINCTEVSLGEQRGFVKVLLLPLLVIIMIPINLFILTIIVFFLALWLTITIVVGVLGFSLLIVPAWLLLMVATLKKTWAWRGTCCCRCRRNKAPKEAKVTKAIEVEAELPLIQDELLHQNNQP